MRIDKIYQTWKQLEDTYIAKTGGTSMTRNEFLYKLVAKDGKRNNLPNVMAILKSESIKYDSDKLNIYSELINILESVRLVIDSDLAEIKNLDEFIEECTRFARTKNAVTKTLDMKELTEILEPKSMRTEEFNPLDLFRKHRSFRSMVVLDNGAPLVKLVNNRSDDVRTVSTEKDVMYIRESYKTDMFSNAILQFIKTSQDNDFVSYVFINGLFTISGTETLNFTVTGKDHKIKKTIETDSFVYYYVDLPMISGKGTVIFIGGN